MRALDRGSPPEGFLVVRRLSDRLQPFRPALLLLVDPGGQRLDRNQAPLQQSHAAVGRVQPRLEDPHAWRQPLADTGRKVWNLPSHELAATIATWGQSQSRSSACAARW